MTVDQLQPSKRDLRNSRLIDLTIDLIAERGVEACTFRNLAMANGTTTRPFTYAFGTRANMLAQVARVSWERLGFAPGHAPEPGEDPLATLFELCTRAVPVNGMSDPAMRAYAAIALHAGENKCLRETLAAANSEGVGAYLELVRAAQAKGQIAADRDPEDLIALIWALGDGIVMAAVSDPNYFDAARVSRIWKQGFDALVAG